MLGKHSSENAEDGGVETSFEDGRTYCTKLFRLSAPIVYAVDDKLSFVQIEFSVV